jgi:hypothetical protein
MIAEVGGRASNGERGGMVKAKNLIALALPAILLTGCTININSPSTESLSSEKQDFLACELWIGGLGGNGKLNSPPGELTPSAMAADDAVKIQNIEVLNGYLEKLRNVDSLLALQVKRILENELEYNTTYLETGEYPWDLALSQLESLAPAGKKCAELGWEFNSGLPNDGKNLN